MKSAAGFLVEVIGAVLIVAAIAEAGSAFGQLANDKAIASVLQVFFLAIAGIVGFALGLFMYKIEALAGD